MNPIELFRILQNQSYKNHIVSSLQTMMMQYSQKII